MHNILKNHSRTEMIILYVIEKVDSFQKKRKGGEKERSSSYFIQYIFSSIQIIRSVVLQTILQFLFFFRLSSRAFSDPSSVFPFT